MTDPIIKFDRVEKKFGEFRVLNAISMSVLRGEKVVICGPSGSGKSTLIRCINGLEEYQSGQIKVDGILVDDHIANIGALRRRVGMVFQQFNLFPHLTILENCTLAPLAVKKIASQEARQNAIAMLHRVRIADQAHKFPAELSGGQQQRAAIARCLTMRPKILLFDEPTSALDPEMVGEVLQVMTELAQSGITMICVTHEMAFARRVADRLVFMEAGSVVHSASAAEFFGPRAPPRLQAFLGQIGAIDSGDGVAQTLQ